MRQEHPQQKQLHSFLNLSSNLSLSQYSSLFLLGLKHIPVPRDTSNQAFSDAWVRLQNSAYWKLYFFGRSLNANTIEDAAFNSKLKSRKAGQTSCNFIPETDPINPVFDEFTVKLRDYMLKYPPSRRRGNQLKSLLEIKSKDPSVVFKAADKNLGLVCLDTTHYNKLVFNCLQGYTLAASGVFAMGRLLTRLTKEMLLFKDSRYWTSQESRFIKSFEDFRFPAFHILPKLHKDGPVKGRPIAGAVNWLTTPFSTILDIKLRPHLRVFPSILKNSQTLVEQLSVANTLPAKFYFITGDVASLYPNIEIPRLLAFVGSIDNSLTSMTKYVCENGYVEYNSAVFLQQVGIAMGTNSAVSLANLYLGKLIDHLLENHADVYYYRRYIDDLFILWTGTLESWKLLASSLNQVNPRILINFTPPNQLSTVFLDVNLYFDQQRNCITTSVFQKALNKYLYISPKSCHTPHTFSGFIKGELTRYARLSSDAYLYRATKVLFYDRLKARGFHLYLLKRIFNNHSWACRDRPALNRTSTLLPFVIPYSLRGNHAELKEIIDWLDVKINERLPIARVLLVYSRAQSLGQILTSSRLSKAQSSHLPSLKKVDITALLDSQPHG